MSWERPPEHPDNAVAAEPSFPGRALTPATAASGAASPGPTWWDPPTATGPPASGYTPAPPDPPPPAPTRRRSRPLRVAAALAGALILGLVVGVSLGRLTRGSHLGSSPLATLAPNTTAARTLYQEALAVTRTSAGFHYVAVSSGGSNTQTITGDAGRSSGRQVISVASALGQEEFTLVLAAGVVYFQGNAPAVEDQLGVPVATAPAMAGKWVSVASSDGPYTVLAPGITVADQARALALVPTSTIRVGTASGSEATRIVGTPAAQSGVTGGSAHLDVANGSHRPLSEVTTASGGGVTISSTTTFSGWGNAPDAATPAGAVAWSTLGASQPAAGYGGGSSAAPSPTP